MKEDKQCKYNAKRLDFDNLTVDTVIEMINDTAKAFDTARAKAQRTAVSLMVLSVKFPVDAVTLANTLCESLGAGVKGAGMVKFLRDKGGFRLDAEGKSFISVKNEEWIRANLEAAKQKMWWSYVPDKPFEGFNLNVELANVLKKAKAQNKALDKRSDEDKAKVEVDMAMVRTIQSLIGGAPVTGDDALALVQKLVPETNVIPLPVKEEAKEASTDAHPELPAEKVQAKG